MVGSDRDPAHSNRGVRTPLLRLRTGKKSSDGRVAAILVSRHLLHSAPLMGRALLDDLYIGALKTRPTLNARHSHIRADGLIQIGTETVPDVPFPNQSVKSTYHAGRSRGAFFTRAAFSPKKLRVSTSGCHSQI